MLKTQNKRSKWSLDSSKLNRSCSQPVENLACPPGYTPAGSVPHTDGLKKTDVNRLITKKSWDIALAPLKQVPMNLLIMYMAGSSISIFPIMMVGMLLLRPIQAMWSIKGTLKAMETPNAYGQILVYIIGNLVNVGLALYKCHSMGLLPTHSSDWLAFVEPPLRQEYLCGGAILS